jgi:hypothetical protein
VPRDGSSGSGWTVHFFGHTRRGCSPPLLRSGSSRCKTRTPSNLASPEKVAPLNPASPKKVASPNPASPEKATLSNPAASEMVALPNQARLEKVEHEQGRGDAHERPEPVLGRHPPPHLHRSPRNRPTSMGFGRAEIIASIRGAPSTPALA